MGNSPSYAIGRACTLRRPFNYLEKVFRSPLYLPLNSLHTVCFSIIRFAVPSFPNAKPLNFPVLTFFQAQANLADFANNDNNDNCVIFMGQTTCVAKLKVVKYEIGPWCDTVVCGSWRLTPPRQIKARTM
ncbi:hypothetical protein PPYR_07282 [Photinus pyralis]|uniref:Uncharacterized protein n=2 Tax=Photinus pyralis TaxID=7054 RepID=A0A5N4APW1_PHOPY|nr:hypothetical protein PPYR_07282 [Photinus pyralis]